MCCGPLGRGTIEGTVEQWMTRDPITVGPDATNGEAAMMMIHGGFRHVPICDHGNLIGIVSIRDLLTLPNEVSEGPSDVAAVYCTSCGEPVTADAGFCANCGARVGGARMPAGVYASAR